jgi:hypothetical protein
MSWETLGGFSTFPQARRKELARRLVRLVQGHEQDTLLPLDEVRARLEAYEQWYVGLRTIRVDDIIGSVDRSTDFDRAFLPKRQSMASRWQQVEQRFEHEAFPPITVFKVGDAYFVEDGHHRVGIARQRKTEFIDAEVTEVKSPVTITQDTDIAEVIHQGMRRWFMRESGLELVRPKALIQPSRPHAYPELLDIVQANGFEFMLSRQEVVAPAVAAAGWYDHHYLPAVELIRSRGLPKRFPKATDTDLYLRVHSQHRELIAAGQPHDVEEAIASTQSTSQTQLTARTRRAVEKVIGDVTGPRDHKDSR